jgi:predicted mannosyl-3-phosphoglycerate phosphatase (HAD superfamily)
MRVDHDETGVIAFVRVDDPTMAWTDESHGHLPWHSAARLCSWGVRLICITNAAADYVRQVQRELRIIEPFICDAGAALHVPSEQLDSVGGDAERERRWDVFKFSPPSRGAAVTLTRDLVIAQGWSDPLTIGVGWDSDDCGILTNVDIPIVVRDSRRDQSVLLRHVPGAYVTSATGLDGWSEALVGPSRG